MFLFVIRLAGQRVSRATQTADAIVADGKMPTRSEIIALLQDYAKADFDMTRSLFQEWIRGAGLADLEKPSSPHNRKPSQKGILPAQPAASDNTYYVADFADPVAFMRQSRRRCVGRR